MKNITPVSESVLGLCKVFVPIALVVVGVHILMMLTPVISGHVLGSRNDLMFRVIVATLVFGSVMLPLILKYYKSNTEYRKKMILRIFPKPDARLEKASVEFFLAFAISLLGYIFLLEVSAQVIQNMYGDNIIQRGQKLSYMASYIVISPIIAITYLRLQD